MTAHKRLALIVTTAVCALSLPAVAAGARIDAHGTAEQVYVTGVKAHGRAALLNARGHVVARQQADAEGGLLFTNVKPGAGYRVRLSAGGARSAPVTVHGDAAKPWDPGDLQAADHRSGYQYLTTRDGTKLAIYVHPPITRPGSRRCRTESRCRAATRRSPTRR